MNSPENTSPDTVAVLFILSELWLLQSVVRHESTQQETWHYPPASLELNDQIATAIDFCVSQNISEAPLLLSKGDCLVLDYTVNQSMKDASGTPVGKNILLKSFAARTVLRDGASLTATEPAAPSVAEVKAVLSHPSSSDDELFGAP